MNFSNNLIFLRKKKGCTLDEIATKTGFSRSQWNNYELGSSYPKFLDFIKISKYFDISETDLIHKDLEKNGFEAIEKVPVVVIDTDMVATQKELIQLQREKIKGLENEISQLKKDIEPKDYLQRVAEPTTKLKK